MLRLALVCKRFERSDGARVALDGVSLEVARGQLVGVFGASGAGKTTLLRVAAGLLRPDSGAVTYNGERLDRMSAGERTRFRRREIACVWAAEPSQERLRVSDHVAMPLLVDRCPRREAERRVREALLASEAEQCARMALRELSDGERQRVAVARALVSEPRLLLADRPACNLSIVDRERIMMLLVELARRGRVAVLVADTDAESLPRADPILYLRDGKLIDPEPLEEHGRVYRFPSSRSRRAAADA